MSKVIGSKNNGAILALGEKYEIDWKKGGAYSSWITYVGGYGSTGSIFSPLCLTKY